MTLPNDWTGEFRGEANTIGPKTKNALPTVVDEITPCNPIDCFTPNSRRVRRETRPFRHFDHSSRANAVNLDLSIMIRNIIISIISISFEMIHTLEITSGNQTIDCVRRCVQIE